uniref:Proline-rich protein 36-like n=1 Tax=Drosophila rhopaloa TaxID=1041015 RepID=A0A6P4FP04_DRORH
MGPGPSTSLPRGPSATLSRGPTTTFSFGPSTTQDESGPRRYPTGKAMEWESEPSDDEESTGQRFRRKEPTLALVPYPPPPSDTPFDTATQPTLPLGGQGPDTEAAATAAPNLEPSAAENRSPPVASATRFRLGGHATPPTAKSRSPSGRPSAPDVLQPAPRAE